MKINYPSLHERSFLKKYLAFYNLLVPEVQQLLPSEIDLVTEFALLPDSKFSYQRFGSLAKNKVIEAATEKGWKLTKLNINNKLYALLDKRFLRRDEDKVIYMPEHLMKALQSFRTNNNFEIKLMFHADK